MNIKTITVTIEREGNLSAIPIPFDPKAVFGKVRASVRVTLNGYTYRSTISRMRGKTFIPLRKSHREAADVEGGDEVTVQIAADEDARVVEIPTPLADMLAQDATLRKRWDGLSYTNRREYAEAITDAKRPETRERRLAKTTGVTSALRLSGKAMTGAALAHSSGARMRARATLHLRERASIGKRV
ncbi:MAG: YdeI/OmpD-associated family protein [Pseudomonadota bacterium]